MRTRQLNPVKIERIFYTVYICMRIHKRTGVASFSLMLKVTNYRPLCFIYSPTVQKLWCNDCGPGYKWRHSRLRTSFFFFFFLLFRTFSTSSFTIVNYFVIRFKELTISDIGSHPPFVKFLLRVQSPTFYIILLLRYTGSRPTVERLTIPERARSRTMHTLNSRIEGERLEAILWQKKKFSQQ